MPNGTVLIFGGLDAAGEPTATAEVIDPVAGSVTPTAPLALRARARHSATLLTDGRILFAGGEASGDHPISAAELWDTATGSVVVVPTPLAMDRLGHAATLLPNGSVLISGGTTTTGQPVLTAEHIDPISLAVSAATPLPSSSGAGDPPHVEAVLPVHDAVGVPVDTLVALRFSTLVGPASVLAGLITLAGPTGLVEIAIVIVESGRLAFLTPRAALEPHTTYVVTVAGVQDVDGRAVASLSARFTTGGRITTGAAGGTVTTSPNSTSGLTDVDTVTALQALDDQVWRGARKNGQPHSPGQELPPL